MFVKLGNTTSPRGLLRNKNMIMYVEKVCKRYYYNFIIVINHTRRNLYPIIMNPKDFLS